MFQIKLQASQREDPEEGYVKGQTDGFFITDVEIEGLSCARQAGRLIFHPAGHIEKARINRSGYMLKRCRLSVLSGDGLSVDLRSCWRGRRRRWKSGQITCRSWAGGLGCN
jgi:hypothetical protein